MIIDRKKHKTFETDRLILRPCIEEDAAFVFNLMNCESWLKFIGDRNVKSDEEARTYIKAKMHPQLKRLGFGKYTVIRKEDRVKTGTCGLYEREDLEGIEKLFKNYPIILLCAFFTYTALNFP